MSTSKKQASLELFAEEAVRLALIDRQLGQPRAVLDQYWHQTDLSLPR